MVQAILFYHCLSLSVCFKLYAYRFSKYPGAGPFNDFNFILLQNVPWVSLELLFVEK